MLLGSAHYYFNFVCSISLKYRHYIAVDLCTVNSYRLDTLAYVIRVLNGDVIGVAAELSGDVEAVPCRRNGRIDLQTIKVRLYTQNVLGDSYQVPCSCTCQP